MNSGGLCVCTPLASPVWWSMKRTAALSEVRRSYDMVALLLADGLFLMTDEGSKHNATRSRLRIYELAYVRFPDFRDFPVGREIPERMSAQVATSGGSADLGFK